jgi:hypothetical protein
VRNVRTASPTNGRRPSRPAACWRFERRETVASLRSALRLTGSNLLDVNTHYTTRATQRSLAVVVS